MALLLKATAHTRMFMMVESADHLTALTGATVTVNISKNGGAFGAAAGAVAEVSSGWYSVTLSTVDTGTAGDLAYHCTATSGDATDFVDQVADPAVATLGANLVNIAGSAVSTSSAQLGVNAVNIAGQAATLDGNNLLEVDVVDIAGSAVSATTAQLGVNVVNYNNHVVSSPATAGVPDVNVKNYNNVTAATDGNNYPKVDLVDIAGSAVSATTAQLGVNVVNWNNTVVATPATAGIPDINVKNIVNAAAAIDGNNYLKVDLVDIAGSAVSASTAQLGVNLVNVAGSAVSTSSAQLGVNAVNIAGQAAALDGNNLLKVDVVDIAGSAVSAASAQLGVNVVNAGGHAVTLDANNLIEVNVTDWDGTAVTALPTNFTSLAIDSNGNVSTTANIKKDTASNNFLFVMTDSTTHAPKTGVTVTGTVCIDGAAFASLTNSVSEVGSGTYKINLAAADVNGNHIMLRFTGSGADDLNIEIITQP